MSAEHASGSFFWWNCRGGPDKIAGRPRSSLLSNSFTYNSRTEKTSCSAAGCDIFIKVVQQATFACISTPRAEPYLMTYVTRSRKRKIMQLLKTPPENRLESKNHLFVTWDAGNERQISSSKAFATMIACLMMSVNNVENQASELFCERLNPRFVLPERTKVNTWNHEHFVLMKSRVTDAIKAGR